jgi:putative ABC transport system permease protein
MFEDLRYGLRLMARNPGVTLAAVLALALGIGANTAIFSVVDTVLLRPLPVRDAGSLVWIWASNPARNLPFAFTGYGTYGDWRSQAKSFESMTAYSPGSANLVTGGEPERVDLMRVNASFLHVMGVSPIAGRGFLAEEDRPGAAKAVILDHGLWQRRFGGDRGVIGKSIVLDSDSYTVVGVLPANFRFANRPADVFLPIALSTARGPGEIPVGAFGRLKPGVPLERAQAEMDAISKGIHARFPRAIGFGVRLWRARDFIVRDVRLSLLVLLGAVGLLLLIACANVANLLLARATAREREVAMRTALGAGRGRIVRQLLTENVMLAMAGGAGGIALAYAAVKLLPRYGPERIPFLQETTIDARVLGFALLVSLVTGLVFGLAPALAASRTRVYETLKEGGRSSGESLSRNCFRGALVVVEVALALVLMIGATLMMQSLVRLQQTSPGFDAEGVLTASITLPAAKYPTPEQRIAFFRQALGRLETMPGVRMAGMTTLVPLSGSNTGVGLFIEGHPPRRVDDIPIFYQRIVDPKYFRVMRIPLLRGREFTEQDAGKPPVAIINETMARRYYPGVDPIGKRFGNGRLWYTVVGVVGDVKHMSLTRESDPEFFEPFRQSPRGEMIVTIRTASDPLAFAPALRQAVLEIDRGQPVSRITAMSQRLSDAMASQRFAAILLAVFGVVALVLASVGIYGVISFSVARRTHEIGVRMALGAAASDVLRMVVGQAVLLAAIGVVAGIAGGLALTRVIRSLLFGVSATDPRAYASVAFVLLAVAALAGYVPARRAARLSPVESLRYE